ncbi:response regulator [Candidatus Parabeggiatoa sp. HSG14]|uniref:response regulator n=1 Tax=Candidatus Parabeggiatoa sp. HSG14 TaxID=3055593 RepID=UPI0025A7C093|nr:response regulator [Thiotrichales bacterium HSG14]
MKLKNLKIRTKLLIIALAIAFIPVTIIGVFALFESHQALSNQAFSQLESVRETKKSQLNAFFAERKADMHVLLDMVANLKQNAFQKLRAIQNNQKAQLEYYFQERLNNIRVLSQSDSIAQTLVQFEADFHAKNRTVEGKAWHSLDLQFGHKLKQYKEIYGYDDLLLIAKDGDIIYTVAKRSDLGQNVLKGVLKNSHLNQVFKKGLNELTLQDFAPYIPAGNQHLAFIAAPFFHADEVVGVLVFSLLPNTINAIVQNREGRAKTEETYIVGQLNGQTSYRSNRIIKEKQAQFGDKKNGADIDKALAEQTGVEIKTGSTGDLEIGAYAPLQIPNLNWCIITTIKLEEVLVSKLDNEQEDFFAKYIHQYNYYDLFLIHPDGKIFYTIEQESDYLTNIINGKYANSELGQLIRKVLQTKTFGMSDFAPYAPSNDEPAAFIAQPLRHNGKIDLVLALQVSDKATNKIMQQRTGMGDTGETYLVGSDKLMRSNSFFDPIYHSIIGSFANPTLGSVDTKASRKALAGETDTKIIMDYRGLPVLSAYTPLKVGDTTWALIAEIDKTEAFTVITKLQWWLSITALLTGIVVLVFIHHATKRLTTPLLLINDHLKHLAKGKLLQQNIENKTGDEIGEIIMSFRQVKEGMKNTIKQANAVASGDYNQEVQLLSGQDQLGRALADMTKTLRETTAQNARQDWLKNGQAELNKLMSGEQKIETLAKNIVSFLTTYIEASVGLFYLLQESKQGKIPYLQLMASYAYTASDNIPNEFSVGEGLVGQAALERKILIRTHAPEEYSHIIQSGLSKAVPRYVIILPFLYENAVKGVIELGSSKPVTETQGEFLEQMRSGIGIAVNTSESRTKMEILLEKSQQQADELQKQQEELQCKHAEIQHSNEELQSQAEELQSQTEELQTQQEELRQTNETLEERTRDLERQKVDVQEKNTALEQTKAKMEKTQVEMEKAQAAIENKAKELELASKYKSEFLANMSHELRTPLNSLLILAQLLSENKDGNLNEKQVEFAQTIHSAGNDLLTLINDILDLSKVEAGKIEVNIEKVSLADLMETIQQKFRHVAENKGVGFHLTIKEDMPSVLHTDGQRLKQIINNLLSNAFKFTSQGKISLTVRHPFSHENIAQMGLDALKTVAISVTDSGIGIPTDKQQVIFEAFQQVDGTTSRRFGGTGLGLSISRQLARLLGGELTLESEENKGSTFTLYLPETFTKKATQGIDSSDSTPVPAKNSIPTSEPASADDVEFLGGSTGVEALSSSSKEIVDDRNELEPNDKSLLIIEDDRKFSKILLELSRGKGFKCLLAEDGLTGLKLAEQYKPQAIILDVNLPQADGWTVMDKLKDNSITRHIPVHFMSAADHSMEAKKMGAIGYLLKPMSMEQLGDAFKTIEQFLTRTAKNLLVVVDIESHQQTILDLVVGEDIQVTQGITIASAFQHIQTVKYDCIILDMDIEQGSGNKLLELMQQENDLCQMPLVIYADRDLTSKEEALLLQCADNIPIKSVRSAERLLDETTLFLHQVDAKLPKEKRNMLRMVHDKKTILKSKKVLIVDDDIRNVYALATVLEDHEMEVVSGKDGKEGLEMLAENEDINIILMDIMMPEMDGYETMQEIRKQPRHRQLPIIALTAKAMKGDKAKCIEAGASDYLAKPVDSDKLLSLMRVWLYR